MRFLLDECIRRAVGDVLRTAGHNVEESRDRLPPATPDPVVSALADEESAIVVTANHKHFKSIIQRTNSQCPRGGLVAFDRCSDVDTDTRMIEALPFIELAYKQRQTYEDTRIIVTITPSTIVIR